MKIKFVNYCLLGIILFSVSAFGGKKRKTIVFEKTAEIFQPRIISTEKSEVKIAFSPNGNLCLWGTLNWDNGKGGWDIWESEKIGGKWQTPVNVSFNSEANDFDPSFAPDGGGVYFFSNRAGGFGGDDIYFVSFDKANKTYGTPQNLGANINSKGDEWGPTVSPDGKRLIFCTDGRGGAGKHDIFISQKNKTGWQSPVRLEGEINSALDDFDATFLSDGRTIVFSSERKGKDDVDLYISYFRKGKYSSPEMLNETVNSKDGYEIGSAVSLSEPGYLYFTTQNSQTGVGRSDIYKIKYSLK